MADRARPTLLIAGPGAGKTYGMVEEIIKVAPQLDANRFLAAITFTNTAADSIRTGVSRHIQIPPNIFIGTIHSFLIRFLIRPYATVLGLAAPDKTYLEIELERFVINQVGRDAAESLKAAVRRRMRESLYNKGIIPLGFVSKLAADIITNKTVRAALGRRLQFLFIDEFQDVDRSQYKVFDQIRIARATSIYAVGDPEQYIASHTYKGTSTSCPKFENIPFFRLSQQAEVATEDLNRRSCEQIVRFTNNFHCELNQVSKRGPTEHGRVVFIDSNSLEAVVEQFREITRVLDKDDQPITRFYLSHENALFRPYTQKFELRPIGKRSSKTARPLEEASKLLCAVSGMSQRQIREHCELDRLAFRGLALKLLRRITAGKIMTEDGVRLFVADHMPSVRQDDAATVSRSLADAADLFTPHVTGSSRHRYSTIHKAKGLEAPAVLAVAKTLSELKQWLTTDKSKRAGDRSDRARLGYVAFTRAEEILCIGCKQEVDSKARATLSSLGVEILPFIGSGARSGKDEPVTQLGLDFGP